MMLAILLAAFCHHHARPHDAPYARGSGYIECLNKPTIFKPGDLPYPGNCFLRWRR